MIKIKYDDQIFTQQKWGGISNYFVEIAKNIKKTDSRNKIIFPFWLSNNLHLRNSHLGNFYKIPLIKNKRIYKILNKPSLKFSPKTDIYHPTYYKKEYLHLFEESKLVITIHDMTPEILPHLFKKNPHEAKKDYALKADRIICVSQKTKDDFLKYHPDIKEQKIKVIYHGINTEENKTKKVSNLPKKYLLFVGRRKGYKNFANMVKGIKNILEEKDIYLVCVGEEFTPQENDFLSFYQIKNKVKHFYANDDQLKYIYKNALMFIYPSLYEGFGMPILEAMSQKCPVALSNSSCFPEIAQDCGFYFNPVDPSSIEKTIKKIIENKKETNKKIKQGFQLCKTFTWEKTAQKTIETYQEALNE